MNKFNMNNMKQYLTRVKLDINSKESHAINTTARMVFTKFQLQR